MKTIVLGYGDREGRGTAEVIAGPDVPISEQKALVHKIKSTRSYPKGVVRIDFCELDVKEVGILLASAEPKQSKSKQP